MKKANSHSSSPPPEAPIPVRLLEVTADQAGRRLDNYLMSIAPGVPKSRLYRAIRSGEVRINKGRTSASYRLKAQDIVRVPPLRMADKKHPVASDRACDTIRNSVLESHKAYLVLDKPSGWAVHGGSGISMGVIEALRQALPGEHYLELVHRLDRSTSGCLLIARKRPFLRELHRQIREGEVKKTYLVLVRGHWDYGRHRCEVSLHTNQRHNGERHVAPSEEGKYCRTDFRPVEFYSGATLLEARLHTGRTHQIRVHCAHLGHPVAGDERYGDDDFNRHMKAAGCARLFLHASSLAFEYPEGNPVHYSAPLSRPLVGVLDKLDTHRMS